MIKEIVTYDIKKKDNPQVLVNKTRKVRNFKAQEVVDCVRDLNDTLDNLIKVEGNKRGAIGLSATQIGIDLAITAVTLGDKRYVLINPSLGKKSGNNRLFRIGCFSLYKYRAMVRYNDDVIINYFDPSGKARKLALKGDLSCVVQHEMDHLVGDLLFASLDNREEDLFVPREALYKDGKVAFDNYGVVFELEKLIKPRKVMSPTVYYSSLFNDYTDYCKFVETEAKANKTILNMIKKHTPNKSSILEFGPTTGALAISLAKDNYKLIHQNNDKDMLELAERMGAQNKVKIKYVFNESGTFKYKNRFNTLFSTEIIETLKDEDLTKLLKNALKIADKLIFQVPTIKVASNTLKGNERLRSISTWKKYLVNNNFNIIDYKTIDNDGFVIFVINS